MHVYQNLPDLIGNTPLLELVRSQRQWKSGARVFAKLEYFNPLGSSKDRVARELIEDAEERGVLEPGALVIEPTSGNTGIGLAYVCLAKGYKLILTMPESMSAERRALLKALGAELVLTPAAEGMAGAVKRAEELAAATPRSFIPAQFDNPANPEAHYLTTGPELWRDTDGCVDLFVAGIGTGGTFSGTGRYLKDQNPAIKVVAVEPASSAVLSGGQAGPHAIQGIGAGFVPKALDTTIYDQIIPVSNEDALAIVGSLARSEGLFMGISSAAALIGALEAAKQPENAGKNIVVLLPDTGMRYLSTEEIFA